MESLRIGWIIPTVGCFGSVREVVEVSNVLIRRGNHVRIYTPGGDRCTWLPCAAGCGTIDDIDNANLDVLIGVIDWKPDLYKALKDKPAKLKAVCLMGIHPSEELGRMLRGEIPASTQALQVLYQCVLDDDMLILADGEWQLQWLRIAVGREVGVGFGGVNTEMFQYRRDLRKGEITIGYSGDVRKRKGTSVVEEAIRIVRERYPKIRTTSYWGKRLSQKEIVEWYQSVDLFLDAHRRGGWCNPVLEAMSCGCVVVCTGIGATSAFAENKLTAMVVPVDDPTAMAEATLWLLEDQRRMAHLRTNAVLRAMAYDYNNVVPELERYLLKELKRRKHVQGDKALGRRDGLV